MHAFLEEHVLPLPLIIHMRWKSTGNRFVHHTRPFYGNHCISFLSFLLTDSLHFSSHDFEANHSMEMERIGLEDAEKIPSVLAFVFKPIPASAVN